MSDAPAWAPVVQGQPDSASELDHGNILGEEGDELVSWAGSVGSGSSCNSSSENLDNDCPDCDDSSEEGFEAEVCCREKFAAERSLGGSAASSASLNDRAPLAPWSWGPGPGGPKRLGPLTKFSTSQDQASEVSSISADLGARVAAYNALIQQRHEEAAREDRENRRWLRRSYRKQMKKSIQIAANAADAKIAAAVRAQQKRELEKEKAIMIEKREREVLEHRRAREEQDAKEKAAESDLRSNSRMWNKEDAISSASSSSEEAETPFDRQEDNDNKKATRGEKKLRKKSAINNGLGPQLMSRTRSLLESKVGDIKNAAKQTIEEMRRKSCASRNPASAKRWSEGPDPRVCSSVNRGELDICEKYASQSRQSDMDHSRPSPPPAWMKPTRRPNESDMSWGRRQERYAKAHENLKRRAAQHRAKIEKRNAAMAVVATAGTAYLAKKAGVDPASLADSLGVPAAPNLNPSGGGLFGGLFGL